MVTEAFMRKIFFFVALALEVFLFGSCMMTPDGPVIDFDVFNGVDWSKVSASKSEISEEEYFYE